jgi:uncharacterized protein YcfJ
MPATTARKGSAAYEKGIREGQAMASRARRSTAPEPEETEEEGEEEEMDMASTSRKRSAKGAKNTKAPMDGAYGKKPMDAECGCSGKKGGKCDGSCGGAMRKRGDAALTPHEYLGACDLGIQDRSRSYIRARLDAAERLDLKCGKGAISKGEKCSKGAATAVEKQPISIRKGVKAGAQIGGGLGAAQGAIGGAMLGGPKGALAGAAIGALGGALKGAVIGGGVQVARKAGAAYGRSRERNKAVQAEIKQQWDKKWKKEREVAYKTKNTATIVAVENKQATEINKIMKKRRDSPYASGFPLDSAALAI